MKSRIWRILRITVGFSLALFMISLVVQSTGLDLRETWRTVDRTYLLAAFLFFGIGFFTAAVRWQRLLHHIGVKMSLIVVVRLALIGLFFNLFVPGGVGGDLIKMVYLKRDAKDKYAEAVLTVFLDRVFGLLGLLILGLLALALEPSMLTESSPEMKAILLVVGLAGLGGLAVVLLLLLWPLLGRLAGAVNPLYEKIPAKGRSILERVLAAMSLLRSAPLVVAALLLIAMVGHFCATFAVMSIGTGVGGVEQVSFQGFLLATQLANLVAAVPLTPGGLGGRDLTMAYLLEQSGAVGASIGAIPVVVTALMIAWSCIGGLALLWERKEQPAAELSDISEGPGEEKS